MKVRLSAALTACLLTAAVAALMTARPSAQQVISALLRVGTAASQTAVQHTSGEIHVRVKDDIPGTAATNLAKAEDGQHTSGDTGVAVWGVINPTNSTAYGAAADYGPLTIDEYGTVLARVDHPRRIHCAVTVATATTIQAVGGSCAAPGAGLSIHVTDVLFAASASGIAADAFPTLKYGTGGTCGSGTAVFWQALTAAAIVAVDNRTMPIKIPANNEICWISSTAGSKAIQISGFIAP